MRRHGKCIPEDQSQMDTGIMGPYEKLVPQTNDDNINCHDRHMGE